MTTELATIASAADTLSSIGRATTLVINSIRLNGIASSAARQRLRDELAAARRYEVAGWIEAQALANMNYMFDLYDRADEYISQPVRYASALRIANQASRLLEDNLTRLARELA